MRRSVAAAAILLVVTGGAAAQTELAMPLIDTIAEGGVTAALMALVLLGGGFMYWRERQVAERTTDRMIAAFEAVAKANLQVSVAMEKDRGTAIETHQAMIELRKSIDTLMQIASENKSAVHGMRDDLRLARARNDP